MRAIFLFVAGTALMLGGCGGGDEPREPPPAPVRLTVTAPSDATTVRAEGVEVRGTVSPARARVLVRGRRVRVTDGAFAASVPLKEGANVIDVAASARGSASAWSAVRITRRTTVTVPDLAGTEAELAAGELRRIGLRAVVDEAGGLFEPLIGGPWVVCESDPPAGEEVKEGGEVKLSVQKRC